MSQLEQDDPALGGALNPDDAHAAATRRMIAILAVCGFASTFALRFIDPMIGVISRDLASDPHTIALLSTAFALPYAFIQPVLGPIGDAVGKERIVQVCLVIMTLTLAGAVVTGSVEMMFVLRVISGAAAGGVIPLALATIGDRVPMAERQVAISRFLLFVISGQLIGGSLSGILSTWIGWRGVFALACAISIAATVAVLVGFGWTREAAGRFQPSVAVLRYARIVSLPRARALFAFVFVEGALIFGIQPYIAPMLEQRGAGGAAQAGLIIACFATGGILYTLTVRSLLRVLGLRLMLVIAGVICGLGFLAMASGGPWGLDAVAMLGMGIGFYMLHNSFQTQVTEVAVDARASAVSLHAFSYFVGQAIGPVLFGLGLSTFGQGGAATVAGVGILVLGLLAARVIGQPRAR
jgi:predicted MFS family arabinose efflux permease